MSIDSTSPIGIFDSGIGGLTVAKAVMDTLPNEDIIYFGDTARVPYGIKSKGTIQKYSAEITRFLVSKNVKMVIIACNSVSAVAKAIVTETAGELPVLNVIDTGTKAAIKTGKKQIGVIGTLATINSGAYKTELHQRDDSLVIKSKACPMLVPLAEEGWTENEVAIKTLNIYLERFKKNGVEALILGCTHYPLFRTSIKKVFGDRDIEIIDSADAVAKSARSRLKKLNLLNSGEKPGNLSCFVSDHPQRFRELAERFLGREIPDIYIKQLQE
ncbi:MAG: glutamate racemase [Balneolaceae bacterium]|nr:MAG: glutamate racemase [Balneolaceae bacterium]